MIETLKRIYAKTKDEKYLDNAVAKGIITEEEKQAIINN